MSGIAPVSATSPATAADPADTGDSGEMAAAFSKGIVEYMGSMLQSSESDIIDAINDTTSDPDAPS